MTFFASMHLALGALLSLVFNAPCLARRPILRKAVTSERDVTLGKYNTFLVQKVKDDVTNKR